MNDSHLVADSLKAPKNSMDECDISVIIITRNEEEVIGECIASVLSALEFAKKQNIIKSCEVILVDSASDDDTISIARKYPIKVIQLDPSWPLSAGAGMYTGVLNSNGKFLAKVDGDSIVCKEWFANALPCLQKNDIAAVTGIYIEEVDKSNMIGSAYLEASKHQSPGEVDVIAIGIFKKNILLEAGSFNPFLKAAEDRDLSWKISELGYKLIKLPFFEMRHYIGGKSKKITYIEYLKKMFMYSVGEGHAARYSIKNRKIFSKYVFRYATVHFAQVYIMFFLWIYFLYTNYLLLIDTFNSGILFIFNIFILALGTFIIIVRYKGKKSKGFLFYFQAIPYIFVRHIGFIRGLIKSPKNPSKYPTKIKLIK